MFITNFLFSFCHHFAWYLRREKVGWASFQYVSNESFFFPCNFYLFPSSSLPFTSFLLLLYKIYLLLLLLFTCLEVTLSSQSIGISEILLSPPLWVNFSILFCHFKLIILSYSVQRFSCCPFFCPCTKALSHYCLVAVYFSSSAFAWVDIQSKSHSSSFTQRKIIIRSGIESPNRRTVYCCYYSSYIAKRLLLVSSCGYSLFLFVCWEGFFLCVGLLFLSLLLAIIRDTSDLKSRRKYEVIIQLRHYNCVALLFGLLTTESGRAETALHSSQAVQVVYRISHSD